MPDRLHRVKACQAAHLTVAPSEWSPGREGLYPCVDFAAGDVVLTSPATRGWVQSFEEDPEVAAVAARAACEATGPFAVFVVAVAHLFKRPALHVLLCEASRDLVACLQVVGPVKTPPLAERRSS